MKQYDLAVIGAGIAGWNAAWAARQQSADISIALLSEERLPYKRTRLSKSLADGFEKDAFALQPREWYRDHSIDLYTELEVQKLDLQDRRIDTDPLGEFTARAMVLATGSMPRVPEIFRDKPYHVLYRAADAERLLDIRPGTPLCVAGSGVLAVEAVEQFLLRGSPVLLTGRSNRLMQRELTPRASAILEELLRDRGIEVRLGADLSTVPDAELLLCCGVEPRVQLARDAGLPCAQGVIVDSRLHTSHPGILAAGDCAVLPGGYHSHLWHAAEAQGRAAGINAALFLSGQDLEEFHPLPWRLKLEIFGRYFFSIGYEQAVAGELIAEEKEEGEVYRWTARKEGRIAALVSIGEEESARELQKAVQEGWKK